MPSTPPAAFHNPTFRRGFGAGIGLVAGLVVLLIALALMFGTFGGKSYMQNVASTRKTAIKTVDNINTNQLTQCIVAYKLTNNRLPQTAEELEAGPSLMDPWNHPMTFSYTTTKEGGRELTTVTWRSAGPDAQMNTEDDILKQDQIPF